MPTLLKNGLPVLLLLCFANISWGQATIQGKVVEASSGKPLEGVNVYLAGTTIGQSTGKNGGYKITTSVSGSYNLVFSFVGFKKQVDKVELSPSVSLTKNKELKEQVASLEGVKVKTSNEKWKRRYNFFVDQFLGKTSYADNVTIENPWALNFKEEEGFIIATSQKPLTITNQALGYKLYVELVMFKWPKYRDQGGAYKMYPKFEQLKANSQKQQHLWKKNRLKNYLGSFQHFLKSLYADKLSQNGFSVNQSRFLNKLPQGKTEYELLSKPGISQIRRNNLKGYELRRKIEVEYRTSTKYHFNDNTESIFTTKYGGVEANTKNKLFFINKHGILLNPVSLKTYGDWARERVANRLPSNYTIHN